MRLRDCLRLFKVKDISKVTEDDLKLKYRRLSLKFHPDRGGKDSQFRFINEAYEYLLAERKKVKKKSQGIRYTVTPDKKFFHYGDGSIFDIEKNRWKRYKKFGIWHIWDYKYIKKVDIFV